MSGGTGSWDETLNTTNTRDAWPINQLAGTWVANEFGEPLLVYRGQHGKESGGGLHSFLPSYSFGSVSAANVYATEANQALDAESPAIMPVYLSIKTPFINNADDPFVDVSLVRRRLNLTDQEVFELVTDNYIAADIMNTDNWGEIETETGCSSVEELIEQYPALVDDLYFSAYQLLDNSLWYRKIKAAGYDGAIHGGSGVTALEAEYRVFNDNQVISALQYPEVKKMHSAARDVVDRLLLSTFRNGAGLQLKTTAGGIVVHSDLFGLSWEVGPELEAINADGLRLMALRILGAKIESGTHLKAIIDGQLSFNSCAKEAGADVVIIDAGQSAEPSIRTIARACGFAGWAASGSLAAAPLSEKAEGIMLLPGSNLIDEKQIVAPRFLFVGVSSDKVSDAELSMLRGIKPWDSTLQTWRESGWFKGVDGQWRFELDDSLCSINEGVLERAAETLKGKGPSGNVAMRVGDLLDHPDLYSWYPELKTMSLYLLPQSNNDRAFYAGRANGSGRHIGLHLNGSVTTETIRSSLIHEIQHAIQDMEGFAYGSSVSLDKALLNMAALAAEEEARTIAPYRKRIESALLEGKRYGLVSEFEQWAALSVSDRVTRRARDVYGHQSYAMNWGDITRKINVPPKRYRQAEHNQWLNSCCKILASIVADKFEADFGITIREEIDSLNARGLKAKTLYRNANTRVRNGYDAINRVRGSYDKSAEVRYESVKRKSAMDRYRLAAGEAEARNAQTRLNLSAEQRREFHPGETLDVIERDLIVFTKDQLFQSNEKVMAEAKTVASYAARVAEKQGIGAPITVVDSQDQLPAEIQKAAAGFQNRISAAAEDGRIYLVADAMTSPQRVEEALLHEAAHLGVETAFGSRMGDAYGAVWTALGQEDGLVAAATAIGLDLKPYQALAQHLMSEGKITREQRIAMLVDEVIAHASIDQNYQQVSLRMRGAVRDYFENVREAAGATGLSGLSLAKATEIAELLRSVSSAARGDILNDRPHILTEHSAPMAQYRWQKELVTGLIQNGMPEIDVAAAVEKHKVDIYLAFENGRLPAEFAASCQAKWAAEALCRTEFNDNNYASDYSPGQ